MSSRRVKIGNPQALEFSSIINVSSIQDLMCGFNRLMNIGVTIVDAKGNVIVATGWQDICTKFHRVHPEASNNCTKSNLTLSDGVQPGTFRLFRCKNNLWNMATPILVGSRSVGNLHLGQFLFQDEYLDIQAFKIQAQRYHFDEPAYLEALGRVPRWDRETVKQAMTFCVQLAQLISELGYKNLLLQQSEEKYRGIFESSFDGIVEATLGGDLISCNAAFAQMAGYSKDEIVKLRYQDLIPRKWDEVEQVQVQKCMERGYSDLYEREMSTKDGQNIPVSMRICLQGDSAESPIGFWGFVQDITKRKRAEAHLSFSQNMLARTERIAHIGSWEWEIDSDTVAWSDELFRIFQLPPSGPAPRWAEHTKLFHPDDMVFLQQAVEAAVSDGTPYEIELRALCNDGDPRVCLARGFPQFGPDGKVVRLFGSLQDISGRKQMEEALRSERNFAENLVETAQAIILVLDPDGRIIRFNSYLETLTGYSLEEVRGKDWFSTFLSPGNGAAIRALFRKAIDDIQTRGNVSAIVAKDGRHILVEWFDKTLKDAGGRTIGLLAVGLDVSERRHAEQERYRLAEAVRQASEAVVIARLDGAIEYANPAFERITGYPLFEVLGQNPRILKSGHHDETFYRNLWNTILFGKQWKGRLRNKRKDGLLYTAECSITPLKDGRGEIVNFVWLSRDVTKEEETEKRIIQAQRIEAIGSLAGGIAHDFNNLLFPIVGMAEMLLEDLRPASPEREKVQMIYNAARRGSDLVRQILSFSRQVENKMIPLRIYHVVKEAVKLARSSIPADIAITRHLLDCGLVLADPTQVHQVVMNLITNAFHAVEKEGGEISVRIEEMDLFEDDVAGTSLSPGRFAVLTVSDTGCGIDPVIMGKIFEPYFTTKGPGKGTGLGLSVVHGIVRDHGGEVRVYSEAGRGAAFHVYLPLMGKPSETQATEKAGTVPCGNERILLVDDEPQVALLEKQMLERLGYLVISHTSGIDALEAFRAAPNAFDLVITDMSMPHMTGDRLAKEILSIRPKMPILVCTGFSEKINVEKAEGIGVQDLLLKPIAKGEMAVKVRKTLDGCREPKGSI